MTTIASEVSVRAYSDRDETQVLDVLRAALGEGPAGERSPRFFRWKHIDNPFGRSFLLVAEADGRIVGLRAFMRWRFRTGSSLIEAVRAVDTATHPDYQRMGIFSRLTRGALETMRGEVDLVFNTPNDKSLPGYLKMGWRVVGKVPVAVGIRKPIAFVKGLRAGTVPPRIPVSGDPAADILAAHSSIVPLLAEACPLPDRLATPKDLAFLRWRYGTDSTLDYRALVHPRGDGVAGLAIFRVKRRRALWETTIAELITAPGDHEARRGLLAAVVRAAPVHHVTLLDGSGWGRAAQAGFVRMPSTMTLVVNPLRDIPSPDPTEPSSWALTLGDVEVF
ncbi:MAG: GNAT family N-acetyltransferase [Actinomycetota bacterium]